MTSSVDGSVRLWDIHTADKSQKTVIRPRCERGTKVSVSCATYLPNASIAAICHDGSLQLWGSSGPYHRPAAVVRMAHQPASTLVATSKTAGLKVPEAGTTPTPNINTHIWYYVTPVLQARAWLRRPMAACC